MPTRLEATFKLASREQIIAQERAIYYHTIEGIFCTVVWHAIA